jgi:radical SAM superfamily enzyme YgiQ (UPF0313 family)
MKIAFVIPAADIRRTISYRLADRFYGPRHPMTGPLILGSILNHSGHQVEIHEELFRDIDFSKVEKADVIGINIMTSSAIRGYEIADFLKKKTNKRIIMGGIHASVLPEEALKHADQVIVGEAESVIKDVVEGKCRDEIVYAPAVKNLDEIPFPNYSLLKTPYNAINVLTSRGCPYSCNFCTTTRMFFPYRRRSPDNVIEELKIHKQRGLKYLCFQDDNFTADKQRAKEILDKMIFHGLIFKETFFYARTDMFDDLELMGLLRRANFRRVFIGIESLNPQSLKYVNKQQTLANIENMRHQLNKHKFKLIASFVIGLDHDGLEDIQKMVAFAKEINAYQLQPQILTPYVGTPIHAQLEKEGRILTKDWEKYDMMHVVYQPRNMAPRTLQKEFFKAMNSFYSLRSPWRDFKHLGWMDGMKKMAFNMVMKFGANLGSIRFLARA